MKGVSFLSNYYEDIILGSSSIRRSSGRCRGPKSNGTEFCHLRMPWCWMTSTAVSRRRSTIRVATPSLPAAAPR
jgi:hypothetical protein